VKSTKKEETNCQKNVLKKVLIEVTEICQCPRLLG
jgi:hypothetical protein